MPAQSIEDRAEKPTLRTIAELSGLAVPTVSRALNDAPDIGRDTKERVRRIAAEIGYVPNRAGVRLRTGRTNVISVVMSAEHDLTNHTGRLISAVAQQLRGTPFHLNFTPYVGADDPMAPIRYIVETRSADALILNQIEPEDQRVSYLMERDFPFVAHGRTVWAEHHSYFDVCNRDIGRLAVEFLAQRGRRKLLLIAPPDTQTYGREFRLGALGAGVAGAIEVILEDAVSSDEARPDAVAAVTRRLTGTVGIDGIITASSSAAMSATAALEGIGLRLGADIDLFSKETTTPLLKLFRPQIHTIVEDVTEAGEFCGRAVIAAVRQPGGPPMQHLRHATEADIRQGRP